MRVSPAGLRRVGWSVRRSRLGRWAALGGRRLAEPIRGWQHRRRLLDPDPSYANEWPHVRELLDRLGLLEDGCAVDIGAGDGVNGSCTLPLFRDHGWRGLALECDPRRHRLLQRGYRRFPAVRVERARIVPGDVAARLAAAGIPREFEFLNLDIDSFDLAVVAALIERYRPAVIDTEVNEKIPPPVRFAVHYAADHVWDESHFFGCSLAAANDVLTAAGYRLEGLEYNNAFFVREDLAGRHGITGAAPERAYREGYALRSGRTRLFPWNADVDGLLDCAPADVVARLARYFHGYAGRFHLGLERLVWRTGEGADERR